MPTKLGAILCLALIGCAEFGSVASPGPPPAVLTKWDVTTWQSDDFVLKQEAVQHIAIGMPIAEAKAVMQAYKFKCSYDRDDAGHAYLDCWITLKGEWFANHDQEIIILYDAGKVTALRARDRIIAL